METSAGLTRRITSWAAGFRPQDVPAQSAVTAKDCILDGMGVAATGASLPVGQVLFRYLDAEGWGSGGHTVIGSARKASATWAAFVNGSTMHSEDWDDTPHTTYALAALLATAEELDSSGEELIAAWVIAYEVWVRMVTSMVMDRQTNPTSVVAPIVAALGCGYLRHFSADQLAHAMGIAASHSGGLRANFGTMAKPMDSGSSARAGVLSAQLAALGWTAETEIFEGLEGVRYKGLFDTFAGPKQDRAKLVDRLGEFFSSALVPADGNSALDPETWPPRWRGQRRREATGQPAVGRAGEGRGGPTVKAWPACFGHDAALTAFFSLAGEPGFDRTAIESMVLYKPQEPTDSATFRTVPQSGLEAKFSVPFVTAAAWLDGAIELSTFRDASFERIRRSGYIERVTVKIDPTMAARGESAAVEAHMRDGSLRRFVLHGRGVGLRGQGVVEKFVGSSAPVLPEASAREVAGRVKALEREVHTRELIGELARDATPYGEERRTA